MMTIISLLLLASLLPHLTFTAHMGVVNGSEAKPHSRPYMVSVQAFGQHYCGGFLISDEFVLTAAHCWKGFGTRMVVVGAHDLSDSNTLKRIGVKDYFPHPNYKISPIQNDIMLLRLQEKVKINNDVKWIALPKDGENVQENTLCSVAGWGELWTDGEPSSRLMEANVYLKNNRECYNRWGEIYYSLSQMMCTYGHGGFCSGDSGGPLVCGDTAVGVVSYRYIALCNSPEKPNVYTKISAYLPWIHQIIRNVK
ncbi:mast cell protease 1A-like [Sinocyclocheilus anshuiensis]|uniref:mast cell protease 1A-like n=1 Tax=Sinocyclocheilus anshuiensis TaxID=1608454 RepID=UPI0007BA3BAC|nr:PREDICTED: mast cell protease 1A-like [Sinocyclocheilus anshuiensis]